MHSGLIVCALGVLLAPAQRTALPPNPKVELPVGERFQRAHWNSRFHRGSITLSPEQGTLHLRIEDDAGSIRQTADLWRPILDFQPLAFAELSDDTIAVCGFSPRNKEGVLLLVHYSLREGAVMSVETGYRGMGFSFPICIAALPQAKNAVVVADPIEGKLVRVDLLRHSTTVAADASEYPFLVDVRSLWIVRASAPHEDVTLYSMSNRVFVSGICCPVSVPGRKQYGLIDLDSDGLIDG